MTVDVEAITALAVKAAAEFDLVPEDREPEGHWAAQFGSIVPLLLAALEAAEADAARLAKAMVSARWEPKSPQWEEAYDAYHARDARVRKQAQPATVIIPIEQDDGSVVDYRTATAPLVRRKGGPAVTPAELKAIKTDTTIVASMGYGSPWIDRCRLLLAALEAAEADAASWKKIATDLRTTSGIDSHEPGHCKKCAAMAAYDARVREEAQP